MASEPACQDWPQNYEICILNCIQYLSTSFYNIQVPLSTLDIYDFSCIFMLANHACLLSAAYFLQFTLEARELYMYGRLLAPVTSATSRSADRFNDTPAGSLPLNPLQTNNAAAACPSLSDFDSPCVVGWYRRFVICIVNRAVDHGGVPATGNDADQSPRFYASSIDHLLGGCLPSSWSPRPLVISCASTARIPGRKVKMCVFGSKVVQTASAVARTLDCRAF